TINQAGVTDEGTAMLLSQAILKEGEQERVEMTRDLVFGPGRNIPFREYRVGDYVYAPGRHGEQERVRVHQITLSRDQNGVVTGNVVLNDRFIEASIRAARRARGIAGGAGIDGGTGTIPTPNYPDGPDERTAEAPQNFTVVSHGYIDSNGNPRGLIEAQWSPVTKATDGSDIEIARYDLYGKPTHLDQNWYRLQRVDGTYTTDSPYDSGTTWQFKVCAVATRAGAGEFSDVQTVLIATDEEPPPAPSAPVLSSRLGTVRASWDGETEAGARMPIDLSHIEVHLGSSTGLTPTPATLFDTLVGERSMTVITDLPYNTDVFVVLVAVDRAGNKSDPSEESSIQVKPLVDTDLIGEIIDGANIIDGTLVASEKIVGESITGELIQALAIEAGNIAANAITADKIEAGAITAEKIQLGAVAPTNIAGAGQNHVTDPGFEDTAYWAQVLAGETAIDAATGSWEISTTTARNGGASIRANLNQTSGNAIAYITPEMPAPSSRQVYISGFCRAGGGSIAPGPNTEVYISVRATRADSSTSYISEGLSQLTG